MTSCARGEEGFTMMAMRAKTTVVANVVVPDEAIAEGAC